MLLLATLGFLSGCGGSGGDDSDGNRDAALLVEPAIGLQTIMNQGGYNSIYGNYGRWMELLSANLADNDANRIISSDFGYDFIDSEWIEEGSRDVWPALVAKGGQLQEAELSVGNLQVDFRNGAGVIDFFGAEFVLIPSELIDLSNQPINEFVVESLDGLVNENARFSEGAQAYTFSNYYRGTAIVVDYFQSCSGGGGSNVEVVSANAAASDVQCETVIDRPYTTHFKDFESLADFQSSFPYGGEFYFEAEANIKAQFATSGELVLFDWSEEELESRGQYKTVTQEGIEFLEFTVPAEIDPYPLETTLLAVYNGEVVEADRYEENIVEGPEDDEYRFNFNDQAMREILQDLPSIPEL